MRSFQAPLYLSVVDWLLAAAVAAVAAAVWLDAGGGARQDTSHVTIAATMGGVRCDAPRV